MLKKSVISLRAALCLLFIGFFGSCFAETLLLKSGQKIEGKILEKTDEYVRINFAGVALTYFLNEIVSIDGKPVTASQIGYTPSPYSSKSPQAIFKDISEAVVYITTQTPGEEQYLGAGFIVDRQGIGVTNYHVIQAAKEIQVKLKSGQAYPVTDVIYADVNKDLFIFKIGTGNLAEVRLGDSQSLQIGETVYCIGNPLGLEYSFSNGLLGGRRQFNNLEYLQFTAPVSPGNSGGPLINSRGEVIGVVTFLMEEGQNLNFALGINEIKPFIRTIPQMSFRDFAKTVGQSEYYFLQGDNYAFQGDYEQAISEYNKAISLNPNYVDAYNNRGLAYAEQGNYAQAISDLNKAISLDPNYANAYNNRGYTYTKQGNYAQAIPECNKAISLNPNDAVFYNNRGYAYTKQGNYAQAIPDLNKAISLDPNYVDAYYNRVDFYYFTQEYAKAWEDVHKAEALGGEIDPEFMEKLKKASGRER